MSFFVQHSQFDLPCFSYSHNTAADILVKHSKTLQEDWASSQSSKFQRLQLLQHGNTGTLLIQKGAHREIATQ